MLDGVEAGCGAEVGKSKESVVESEVSGCKMSKKMQARVVEANVESGLLFGVSLASERDEEVASVHE